MEKYTEDQLKEVIEKDYGFKKELVMNPVLRGLWQIQFEVNGIKYYGSTPYAGALPQLRIGGYTAKYYDNYDAPVSEEYYIEYIKNKKIVLRHCIGEDCWEDINIPFQSQEEVKEYISKMDNPNDYSYDFK
jgi:hypothetical protein